MVLTPGSTQLRLLRKPKAVLFALSQAIRESREFLIVANHAKIVETSSPL
jgi:hypothetical protein